MKRSSERDFATYPRQFKIYRWFKPILTGLLAVVFFFLFLSIVYLITRTALRPQPGGKHAESSVHGKSIIGGYSGTAVKPIALRFISDLYRCPELSGLHLSGMGGIGIRRDALEFLLLGAGSVQITTAFMQYGYRIIEELLEGLTRKHRTPKSPFSAILHMQDLKITGLLFFG